MKYSDWPFEINKTEYERLRQRRAAYQQEVGGSRNCRTTLVTSCGVKPGKYRSVAQAEVTLDDLFA